MKRKKRVFLILLGISILCNFLFAYKIFQKIPTEAVQVGVKSGCEDSKENSNKKELLSTAEILPHPPDFLKGKKIQFFSYTTRKENGKKWILFQEKIGNRQKEAKVDAEAVRWF
ncbi:hypothetical protein [Leptospira alexanderi]|uniref:hypothetical protein n=1 Tax=Leptospira alexanderi TaxID=100053 RepID=UPI000990F6DC|nr:hypothetical protein [Leptospira alexanderi]